VLKVRFRGVQGLKLCVVIWSNAGLGARQITKSAINICAFDCGCCTLTQQCRKQR